MDILFFYFFNSLLKEVIFFSYGIFKSYFLYFPFYFSHLPLLYILAAVTRYFTTKRQEDNYKKSERDAAEKKKRVLYERKKEVCY